MHARRAAAPTLSLVAAMCVLVHASPGADDDIPAPETMNLAGWLEPHRERSALPALGAVLVTSSDVVALGTTGRRSLAHDVPVTPADAWHLGSITKSMTATVAARLVAADKIDFDSTVHAAVGDRFPGMHRGYRRATLHQLLAHRGGLRQDLTGLAVWHTLDITADPPQLQRQRLLAEVLAERPRYVPGRAHFYANAGYVLAATMLEARDGRAWETLMHAELFEPLGLRSAGIGPPGQDRSLPDQPWGHRERNGREPMPPGPFADHPPALAPAGTAHMNLADLGRYLQMHLNGARSASDFLPSEHFRVLHTALPGYNDAPGWFVEQPAWARGPVLMHDGSNTLWYALAWIAPADDLAVAVVTNAVPDELDAIAAIATALVTEHLQRR